MAYDRPMRRLVLILLALVACRRSLFEVDRTETGLGSYLRVRALAETRPIAESAVSRAFAEMHRLDTLWSSFAENSEVVRLNRQRWMKVSPETRELIEAGVRLGERTKGAFDITVQPLVAAWGFLDGRYRVPDSVELAELVKRIDYRRVAVSGDTVMLDDAAMLDLGGIAAGMAVDRAVEVLRAAGARQGLVDAGGDIRVFGDRVWRIGVQDPRGEGVVRVLKLKERAASTSGDYQKFFERNGVRYCHVLNPETGLPVQGVAGVTVVALTSLEADAFSTAVMALGPDSGLMLLAAEKSLAAVAAYEVGGRLVWREAGRVP